MGGYATTPVVLDYLETVEAGTLLTAKTVAKATGLDERQVRNSMRSLVNRGLPIEVVITGNAWRYGVEPEDQQEAEETSEEVEATDGEFLRVGTTSDGSVIAKGNNTGKLYKVSEL